MGAHCYTVYSRIVGHCYLTYINRGLLALLPAVNYS